MGNNMNQIKQLENTGVLQTLLFLGEKGKTKITDIPLGGSKTTLYRALNILTKLELIDEERRKPFTRYIQLTDDGETIAKKLSEINTTLEAKRDHR